MCKGFTSANNTIILLHWRFCGNNSRQWTWIMTHHLKSGGPLTWQWECFNFWPKVTMCMAYCPMFKNSLRINHFWKSRRVVCVKYATALLSAASPVINHQAARLATVTVLRLDEWWSLKPVKLLFLNGSRPETFANADTFPGVLIYTEKCVPFTAGLDRSVVNGNIDMPKMQHKNQLINIFFWKYHSWLQATLAEAEAVIRCILAELRSVEFLNLDIDVFKS